VGIEYKVIFFIVATIYLIWISRPALRDVHHHGFYRFFSWETILILFLMNINYWFVVPFSLNQIIAWTFLTISLLLIIQGLKLFRQKGGIDQERGDLQLIGVERTTELVVIGIYGYIRHPFYSSLLFLGWGIFFKNICWIGMILAIINTVLLVITAKIEEGENIEYFGEDYRQYMKQTKMFVPYLF
jgi:protein-S-isoprenylcysteine O-methyltransferase Ste14